MGLTRRPGRRAAGGATGPTSGGVKKATFEAGRKKEVGVSDLTLLSKVTDEAILDNLKQRFFSGLIYTYIGHVLISVNPFRDLGIYSEQVLESYRGKNRLEVPPHVFAIAESMYYNMKSYDESQCVIISGESGAGKTEAAKRIMQYIAAVSGQSTSTISKIKDMVLATNPLLESFGCATTLRNDNSSRHGKFLEILFNAQNEPAGAHITNYLLEKNRVVGQIRNERNFHIFYQYTKGAPQRYREMYGVQTPDVYTYTSKSGCTSVNGIDDVKDFNETLRVMGIIGLSQQEQDDIFKMLSAILWLGNVTFVEADDSSTSIGDQSVTNFAAYLLDVDANALATALTTKIVETGRGMGRGEVFESPLNRVQALAVRDALAKHVYSKLFDWIVERVNKSLLTQIEVKKSVGILDIYGFEIFEHNSFEQICINYVNEKLQQIFIQLTLKAEQDEYIEEKIQWTPIDYFNNKIVCDLIEEIRPPGIFAVLNDACATAHADSDAADQSFGMKLNMLTSNPHLQVRSNKFIIKHYAGDVTYNVDAMTDKNKDQLGKSLTRLLATTSNPFLAGLFPEAFEEEDSSAGKRKRRATASDLIKRSANDLMTTLAKSRPSYIRTIKPNGNRSPTELVDEAVLHQIKYLGLKENVRIRRAGFASRQPFESFVERFYLLSSKTGYAGDYIWQGSHRDATLEILRATGTPPSEWQMGVSKVFIKTPETLFALEHMRDMYWHNMASRIQRAWRRHFKRRMEAILVLQKACKTYLGIAKDPTIPPPDDSFYAGRKERRRFSMLGERAAYGDYLVCNDPSSAGGYLVQSVGIQGNILFSARGEQLFSKLGRSAQRLSRTFILTPTTFYTVRGDILQGKLVYTIERQVAVSLITGIETSTYRDDWFAVRTQSKETSDMLLWCLFKTELIGLLQHQVKVAQEISYCKKPGKVAAIKFAKDGQGLYDTYKSGVVHVGQGGLPGNTPREEIPKRKKASRPAQSRPAQPRPAQRQAPQPVQRQPQPPAQRQSTQQHQVPPPPPPPPAPPAPPAVPQYKAMYDFPGTNAGELGVSAGEVITVEQDSGNGWSLGKNASGKTGWVPTTYIQKVEAGAPSLASGLAAALSNESQRSNAMASDLANALRKL